MAMFFNHFKLAWRNLRKNRVYSFINIFGLTAGLSCFLLIALYIFDELTFDQFHINAKSIYRVIDTRTSKSGKESKLASVAFNISEQGQKVLPEINNAVRFVIFGRNNVFGKDKTHPINESYNVASSAFFKVFSFPILHGDPVTSFKDPHTVVLRDETAIALFGKTDVVGSSIDAEGDSIPFKVVAVVHIPSNSHLQFNILYSESTFMPRTIWISSLFYWE